MNAKKFMSDVNPTEAHRITEREQEILALLAEGLSNQEIADRIVLSLTNVKWYNHQIFRKLGVDNRARAVLRAHELNLLSKPSPDSSKRGVPNEHSPLVNPYKGVHAFQTSDFQDFFGREKVT